MFGVNLRDIQDVGVAHVATLASFLLSGGTRVSAYFEPRARLTTQELLTARLIDDFRAFAIGMSGNTDQQIESVIDALTQQVEEPPQAEQADFEFIDKFFNYDRQQGQQRKEE